jgi:hypothetical protein
MTKQDLSLLAIRLLAVYLISQGLLAIPDLYILASIPPEQLPGNLALLGYGLAIITPFAAGLFFFIASTTMAKWICPNEGNANGSGTATAANAAPLAFATLGLFIIATTLSRIIATAASIYQQSLISEREPEYFNDPSMLGYSVTLLLGISLFAGVRFWVALYQQLKTFGLKNK